MQTETYTHGDITVHQWTLDTGDVAAFQQHYAALNPALGLTYGWHHDGDRMGYLHARGLPAHGGRGVLVIVTLPIDTTAQPGLDGFINHNIESTDHDTLVDELGQPVF